MRYLGEGDIAKEKIVEEISKNNLIIYGSKSDNYYKSMIKEALEIMNKRMNWRTFYNRSRDPLADILKEKSRTFYDTFDNLRRSKIDIYLAGDRYNNPFIIYIDRYNYVAGVSSKSSLFIGHGLLEAWSADPRIYLIDGRGYKAFYILFHSCIAYLIALFIGADRSSAREVQIIFDKDRILDKNLEESNILIENDRYPIASSIQRKASIALRGYLNAWFAFMNDASWLEIHHTLLDTKIVEKEQTFLDTATTEISETARGIILDDTINNIFSAVEMERREKERREKEMDWTLLRIALGILYKREKEYLEMLWNKKKRKMSWEELQETYYEEIWDLIRMHLSGGEIESIMDNKELKDLGKWHFIFESRKSYRPRDKIITLEKMSIEQLFERKNILLNMLEFEGIGLPPDARWDDIMSRFRKIMIKYHPDRVEITKIDLDQAREITSKAISVFRELEIIHDLEPSIFGISILPEDYIKEKEK